LDLREIVCSGDINIGIYSVQVEGRIINRRIFQKTARRDKTQSLQRAVALRKDERRERER
jgi:hypothetical protein